MAAPTNIYELLKLHEGLKLKVYTCTAGKKTIGIGRNLTDVGLTIDETQYIFGRVIVNKPEYMELLRNNGITEHQAMYLCENDLKWVNTALKSIFADTYIPATKYVALQDMMFNLGSPRFKSFKKVIKAVKSAEWTNASVEMLDSRWAEQVGDRANTLSDMVKVD